MSSLILIGHVRANHGLEYLFSVFHSSQTCPIPKNVTAFLCPRLRFLVNQLFVGDCGTVERTNCSTLETPQLCFESICLWKTLKLTAIWFFFLWLMRVNNCMLWVSLCHFCCLCAFKWSQYHPTKPRVCGVLLSNKWSMLHCLSILAGSISRKSTLWAF